MVVSVRHPVGGNIVCVFFLILRDGNLNKNRFEIKVLEKEKRLVVLKSKND